MSGPPPPTEFKAEPSFERDWIRFERVIEGVILIAIALGLAGGLGGGGYLSATSATLAKPPVAIETQRVVRASAPFDIEVRSLGPLPGDLLTVGLSQDLLDRVRVTAVNPRPLSEKSSQWGSEYVFNVGSDRRLSVDFTLSARNAGLIHYSVAAMNTPVAFAMLALP